ncbi:hypothetical protein [Streptomyces sp. NPDC049881]|uniref:hypothetical protein n=1 Tax=unclassified Streptomyces TaxID=2593676 RepID=UPI00341E151A
MSTEPGEDGSEGLREWTDPRYADLVEAYDRTRRNGRPTRFFLYELPDPPSPE